MQLAYFLCSFFDQDFNILLVTGYGHAHLKMYFKLKYTYITFLCLPPNCFHFPSTSPPPKLLVLLFIIIIYK